MFAFQIVQAVGAGLISFLSPCVLPLVPAYLSFVSGASVDEIKAGGGTTRKVVWRALAFILGFTVIFVALGAWGAAMAQFVQPRKDVLLQIGGAVLVIFGLHMTGVLRIGFLYREKRAHVKTRPAGFLGAALVGAAFCLGWSPCVAPFLTWILLLTAKSGKVIHGMVLMAAYSAGLGLPLLAAAVGMERFLSVTAGVKKHFRAVEIVGGAILAAAGLSMFFGRLSRWSIWINAATRGSELMMLFWLAAIALVIAAFAFWIWMLVDCLRREFRDPTTKLMWALVIIFVHFIGALIYFLLGRPTGTIQRR